MSLRQVRALEIIISIDESSGVWGIGVALQLGELYANVKLQRTPGAQNNLSAPFALRGMISDIPVITANSLHCGYVGD